jgi:hypothetical protein
MVDPDAPRLGSAVNGRRIRERDRLFPSSPFPQKGQAISSLPVSAKGTGYLRPLNTARCVGESVTSPGCPMNPLANRIASYRERPIWRGFAAKITATAPPAKKLHANHVYRASEVLRRCSRC